MFREESPLSGPVLETARASVLSPQLTLQVQIGNCVEALMLLSHGMRSDPIVRVVADTARRLREGAEDTGGGPRTVEQTALTLGVLQAATLALLSEDRAGTTSALRGPTKRRASVLLRRADELIAFARPSLDERWHTTESFPEPGRQMVRTVHERGKHGPLPTAASPRRVPVV